MKPFGASTVLFSITLFLSAAHATNGYFAHGYGTKNKAMAGAGVALDLAVDPAQELEIVDARVGGNGHEHAGFGRGAGQDAVRFAVDRFGAAVVQVIQGIGAIVRQHARD